MTFDFSAPKYYITKADRAQLERSPDGAASADLAQARVTRFSIGQIVQAAFPQGMDRRDGRVWAAWQETLEEGAPARVEVNKSMVAWLRGVATRDDLRVPSSLAQWREALIDYLGELLDEAAAPTVLRPETV